MGSQIRHAHHVIHWADGGPTEEHNLVMLCPFHHHLVHEAAWSINGDPTAGAVALVAPRPTPSGEHGSGVVATPAGQHGQGDRAAPCGERPPPEPGRITDAHRAAGFTPELVCHWDGSRPDYGWISDVLAGNRNREATIGN